MKTKRKGRPATGTVVRTRDGRLQAIVTLADGTRKRIKPFPRGTSEAYAEERAKHWAERAQKERIIGGTSRRRPRADGPIGEWWDRFFKHRDALEMTSVCGIYTTHIQPVITAPWPELAPADAERLRDELDARVAAGELAAKTAFNAWTVFRTACKAASGRWAKDKRRTLKVRETDPSDGVVGPDYDPDDARTLQWLYPREVLAVAACADVPLVVRRRIVLATYLCLRGGELKALTWQKLDLERGVVIVDAAYDRERKRTKKTKSGNRGNRRFSIEATVLPLLRALHRETGGAGSVIDMPEQKHWARELREALQAAGVKRPELYTTTPTSKRVRFHDLKASGLTWKAIRGDSPAEIQYIGAHTTFDMTRKYIDAGGSVDLLPGEVPFPPLPDALLGPEPSSEAGGSGGNFDHTFDHSESKSSESLWRRRESNPGPRWLKRESSGISAENAIDRGGRIPAERVIAVQVMMRVIPARAMRSPVRD